MPKKNSRQKVNLKAEDVSSWDEADNALKELAVVDEYIRKEEATYNEEEQERRAKLTASLQPKRSRKQELEVGLERFVMANREEFKDKRSKRLKHGEVNFRIHPPSVRKDRRMTWAVVLDLIRASKKWAKSFLKIKEDADKDAIIKAHRNGEIDDTELQSLGLAVIQKETFGYKTDLAVKEDA